MLQERRTKKITFPQVFTEHGKVPPQATDLEELVLGAIMLESRIMNNLNAILKPEIFYRDHHGKIYRAIQTLFEEKHPIDISTVTNQLRKIGELDIIGGPYYITQLTNRIGSASNVEFHCRIIIQKWMQREVIRMTTEMQNKAFDDNQDVLDTLEYYSMEIKNIQEQYCEHDKTPDELIKEAKKEAYIRANNYNKNIPNCIPTCVPSINKKIGGFERGEVCIIAARPSMGKSQLMLKCAEEAEKSGNNPLILSLEMTAESLITRRICSEGNIDSLKYRVGNLSIEDLKNYDSAADRIALSPINIVCASDLNSIISKIRTYVNKFGCEIVFIDYLQLIKIDNDSGNDNVRISKISRELNILSKELRIPIVLLSQLNRQVEQRGGLKMPMLSDLRDSGCLHGDTKIYCPSLKSNVRIKDLIYQNKFNIFSTSLMDNKKMEAKKCFKTGNKEVFEISLLNGQKINATSNHKFLTPEGWVELRNLENKSIAIPLGIENEECEIKDSEIRLIGHFLSIRVALNQLDDDLANLIMEDAINCTNNKVAPRVVLTNTLKSKFATVFFKPTFHLTHGKTSPIADIMIKYNLFDVRTKQKFVPERFFFMSKRQICLLLSALFTWDGTVYYQEKLGRKSLKISYSSASPQLIEDIQQLLLIVGIVSFVSNYENKKNQKWQNLYISGKANIKLFVENIKFLSKRKNDILINGWEKSKDNLAGWNKYQYNENRSLCFMPIKTIRSIGFHDVYDIEVDKYHNFIANGIVAHNSVEQDGDLIMFLWRPAYYGIESFEYMGEQYNNMDMSDIFVIVAKFRNGSINFIHFKCLERMSGFKDCEEEWHGGNNDANAGIKANTNFYEKTEKEEEPF